MKLLMYLSVFTIFQILVIQAATSETQSAVGDYVTIENATYFISAHFGWFDAFTCNDFCKSINMTLISFETQHEWIIVTDYILSNGYNDNYYTSGGRVYDKWVWSGQKEVEEITFYDDFYPREDPLDTAICVCFDAASGYFDEDCSWPWSYVCEELK